MESTKTPAAPGRPRAFCVERALDRALQVFWQKGYEGASLSELTQAMGINRPSLYAAYGNKEELFRKALGRYAQSVEAFLDEHLSRPTAREAVESLFYAVVDALSCPTNPQGCMTVRCNLAGTEAAESVRRELAQQRQRTEVLVRRRLERAQSEGDLPPGADPADLARYVATLQQGMSVQAAGGATHEQLRGVVRTALAAWPSSTR